MHIDPPLLTLVIAAALVSALNPCTIGVLTMLISVVLGGGHRTSRMFWLGLTYIVLLMTTSLVVGVLAFYLMHNVPPIAGEYSAIGIGLLVVAAGLAEIKYYLWYGQGFGLRLGPRATAYVLSLTKGHMSFARTAWLGMVTGIVALPCTGAAYMAIISIMRNDFSYTSLSLIGLYNLLLVLPMVLLVGVVASGYRVSAVQRWREAAKGRMRLGTGLLLIMLGWIIILTANGVLNFG